MFIDVVLTSCGLIPAHAGKTLWELAPDGAAWAHPRSRGENGVVNVSQSAIAGSSPLTRGKPAQRVCEGHDIRLIPAHAGKTLRPWSANFAAAAHPRSRGENEQGAPDHVWPVGSSPLTRGKHRRQAQRPGRAGLIPAHAGKTAAVRRCPGRVRAHPRSRGENLQVHCGSLPIVGSSPLTRGKQPAEELDGRVRGLIPAHAGKT